MTADTRLNFGDAIQLLKEGARLARTGWNGRGMFIYLVPAASYPVQTGAAKAHFGAGAMVPYNAYLAIKNVDETVSTWVPSVSDCLAEDWVIVGATIDTPEPVATAVPPHQQRVLAEKMDRDQEITRLDTFIRENLVFQTLSAAEQSRLRRQLDVMHALSAVLGERIAAF